MELIGKLKQKVENAAGKEEISAGIYGTRYRTIG